jgi:hypothetical protein
VCCVRVGEPEGNGLMAVLTFCHGAAKCESAQQEQKKKPESLK